MNTIATDSVGRVLYADVTPTPALTEERLARCAAGKANAALCALASVSLVAADIGVRIRFGLTDTGNTVWDGKISVAPGAVERIDGWRFQDSDQVLANGSWKASTRPLTVRRANNPKKQAKKKAAANGMIADNGVFAFLTGVTEQSVVSVETAKGNFSFKLAEIPYGKIRDELGGNVDIERVASSRPLTSTRLDDDYPSLAVAPDAMHLVERAEQLDAIFETVAIDQPTEKTRRRKVTAKSPSLMLDSCQRLVKSVAAATTWR